VIANGLIEQGLVSAVNPELIPGFEKIDVKIVLYG
jgi:hypothetical protein